MVAMTIVLSYVVPPSELSKNRPAIRIKTNQIIQTKVVDYKFSHCKMGKNFIVDKKLVVISGASQGLGASIAKELVKDGANVVIVSRTERKLKEKVLELKRLAKYGEGQRISYIAADVSDAEECKRVFAEIADVPDIVLCCAGNAYPGLFVDIETDVLAQNLKNVYCTSLYFSHAGMKAMIKGDLTKKRHLVFCSSVLAVFPFIGYSGYGPAKAATRALADILRQECIPYNIRVTNVLPGNMDTEGFAQEEKTKPEITRIIEGSSKPLDPDQVAVQVIKDLNKGRQMIYTDFIGWVLSANMLGVSPRTLGFFQALVAIFFALFGGIVNWTIENDIRKYFAKNNPQKTNGPIETEAENELEDQAVVKDSAVSTSIDSSE